MPHLNPGRLLNSNYPIATSLQNKRYVKKELLVTTLIFRFFFILYPWTFPLFLESSNVHLKGSLLYFIQHFQVFLAGGFQVISFVCVTENRVAFLFNMCFRDRGILHQILSLISLI